MLAGTTLEANDRFLGSVGVVLRDRGPLITNQMNWYHSFVIAMPDTVPLICVSERNAQMEKFCKKNQRHPLYQIIGQMDNDINYEVFKFLSFVSKTLNSFSGKTRKQRNAPLSFIGDISKSIFGTATMADLKAVVDRVDQIIRLDSNITTTLQSHVDIFKTFMTIENERYNNMKEAINQTRENLKAIQETAKTIPDELEKTYAMSALTTMAKNISGTTFNNLYRIRQAILELKKGYISPVLVSDEEFQLALDKIAAKASISTGYNRLLHKDAEFYRRQGSFILRYQRYSKQIWLTLKFPMGTSVKETLYEVKTLPVPLKPNSDHATKITSMPPFIVERRSLSGFYYAVPEISQLSKYCKTMGNFNRECKINFEYKSFSLPTCVAAVLKGNDDLIHRHCSFELLRDHLKVNVPFISISADEILITRKEEITMHCPYGNHLIMGCNYCQMKVPCGCHISNGDHLIMTDSHICKEKTFKVDYMHLKNIITLKEFFQASKNDLINSIHNLKEIKMHQLPEVKFHDSRYKTLLALDHNKEMDVNHVLDKIKQNKQIFTSLADPILTGNLALPDDWSSPYAIMTFVMTTVSPVLLIYICYIYFVKQIK